MILLLLVAGAATEPPLQPGLLFVRRCWMGVGEFCLLMGTYQPNRLNQEKLYRPLMEAHAHLWSFC